MWLVWNAALRRDASVCSLRHCAGRRTGAARRHGRPTPGAAAPPGVLRRPPHGRPRSCAVNAVAARGRVRVCGHSRAPACLAVDLPRCSTRRPPFLFLVNMAPLWLRASRRPGPGGPGSRRRRIPSGTTRRRAIQDSALSRTKAGLHRRCLRHRRTALPLATGLFESPVPAPPQGARFVGSRFRGSCFRATPGYDPAPLQRPRGACRPRSCDHGSRGRFPQEGGQMSADAIIDQPCAAHRRCCRNAWCCLQSGLRVRACHVGGPRTRAVCAETLSSASGGCHRTVRRRVGPVADRRPVCLAGSARIV